MVKKVFLYFSMICGVFTESMAQPDKNTWVDSVFNSLSIEEKIGQLFMVPIPSQPSEAFINKIESQIKSKEIGGVIFATLGPVRQAKISNRLQSVSEIPLLIAQDAPQGLGQLRDSVFHFPDAMVAGAARNDSLAYILGKEIARQMKILGAHVNVASIAGIANGSLQDSTIHQSFGQNNERVASKAVAFMKGLQDHGVLATAKNFAINGATILDEQNDLPLIEASVDSINTFSFFKLFENGLAGVMPSAASFPLFFNNKSQKNEFDAETISLLFTGNWLKKKSNYQGLILVNIQHRNEVVEKGGGDDELIAFKAGNDVLISAEEFGPAIRKIKRLIRKEEKFDAQLTSSVRKILAAKFDAGLWRRAALNTDNLVSKLNSPEGQLVSQKLYEAAITVIQDKQNMLPISMLENRKFIYINTTTKPPGEFYHYLSKYTSHRLL